MKSLLFRLFVDNWMRKLVALILAAILWLVVNQSLTTTRNIAHIPVRVINIPAGFTIEGVQPNGRLSKKITLTLVGNKTILDELTPYDLEVVLDATDKSQEWVANIAKKNLIALNPEIDISKGISRVYHPNFAIRMSRLASEKIPIKITQPIGEAPRGYQFLDVWPYRLTLTVSGPEEVIKRLKLKEQTLTFNLSDITKTQLDAISESSPERQSDIVSFFVPDQLKQIPLSSLSDTPLEINDPEAKSLRIDFIHCDLLPLNRPIPVELFFPEDHLKTLSPDTTSLLPGEFISKVQGQSLITTPLYVNGVDRVFLQIVQDRFQIVVLVDPSTEKSTLDWSISFVNPRKLEDLYVKAFASQQGPDDTALQTSLREEYLRNRFRSYMQRFRLFRKEDDPLKLAITLKDNQVELKEVSSLTN